MTANNAESSRGRVLASATNLFAAKGFKGTSTREISRNAHVSEVTIFRIFKNKQQLYVEVLERSMPAVLIERLDLALREARDDKEAFNSVAAALVNLLGVESLRLLLFATLEHPDLVIRFLRPRFLSIYDTLGGHISSRISDGAFRSVEPLLSASALIGMIVSHRVLSEFAGGQNLSSTKIDVARVLTDIWLNGVLGRSAPLFSTKAV
jgi:AcrR family transcriptional regulator